MQTERTGRAAVQIDVEDGIEIETGNGGSLSEVGGFNVSRRANWKDVCLTLHVNWYEFAFSWLTIFGFHGRRLWTGVVKVALVGVVGW